MRAPLCTLVLLLAAACGGDDAAGPAGLVGLTIEYQGGAPLPGVLVYFLESDSTLAVAAHTDATGRAEAMLHAGGSVTVVDPGLSATLGNDTLFTYGGVQPGDEFHFRLGQSHQVSGMAFTVPPVAGATRYQWSSSCGGEPFQLAPADPTAAVRLGPYPLATCGYAMTDVLVYAYDDAGLLATLYRGNVALAEGATLDLTGEAFVPARDLAYHIANGVGPLIFSRVVDLGGAYDHGDDVDAGMSSDASGTVRDPVVPGLGHYTTTSDYDGIASNAVTDRDPGEAPSTYALDFSTATLVPYASAPQPDYAAHGFAWTSGTGGLAPDFATATFVVARTEGGSQRYWNWTLIQPWTDGAFTPPALPTSVHDYAFVATDTVSDLDLRLFQAPGGYDAIRTHAWERPAADVRALVTSGRLAYSVYQHSGAL